MLNTVGILFLILFCIAFFWDLILTWLNLRHMRKGEAALPEVFQAHIDARTYQKSIAYNRDSEQFGVIHGIAGAVLLIVLVYFGGFETIDRYARSFSPQGYYSPAFIFAGVLFLIKFVIDLPFTLYDTFVLEARYDFNRTTPRLFVVDLIKSLALTVVLGVPLYLGILWFMIKAGDYWWLWTWLFLEGFQIFMLVIYPTWIAPLFNKFTPLEEGTLKEGINSLVQKAHFPVENVFIMDGSKRSSHSNAFFTGLGKKKRIVLFDTLVAQMDAPKILSVLAHEIGHYKLNHIKKYMLAGAGWSLLGLYFLSVLIDYEPFYHGLGFSHPSNYAALIIFSLCASTISVFFKPLLSALSRRHEYAADRFAVKVTESPRSMAEVIALLTKENLSNLNPHPWYSFFHYSHPAPVERVQAIFASSP